MVEGQEYGYSDTFGIVRTRRVNQPPDLEVSTTTEAYPEFVELIIKWAKQEFGIMKNFPFTTFTINGGEKTTMHRDSHNAGASCIIGLGNYEQGQMLLWDQDDGEQSLDELSQFQPELVDIKNKAILFDGRRTHVTEEFAGT